MIYLLHRYRTRFTWLNLVDTESLIINHHNKKKNSIQSKLNIVHIICNYINGFWFKTYDYFFLI